MPANRQSQGEGVGQWVGSQGGATRWAAKVGLLGGAIRWVHEVGNLGWITGVRSTEQVGRGLITG